MFSMKILIHVLQSFTEKTVKTLIKTVTIYHYGKCLFSLLLKELLPALGGQAEKTTCYQNISAIQIYYMKLAMSMIKV